MAFKQKGNSLAIWAMDRTDLTVPTWLAEMLAWLRFDQYMLRDGKMGKELFSSLNPFFVIVFSPLLVAFWGLLRYIKMEVPTPAKLVLGFSWRPAAFGSMWWVAANSDPGERVTPTSSSDCYALLTLGELCLSPMGLSLVSRLAPAKTRAVWMGMFFVSMSLGGALAGAVPISPRRGQPISFSFGDLHVGRRWLVHGRGVSHHCIGGKVVERRVEEELKFRITACRQLAWLHPNHRRWKNRVSASTVTRASPAVTPSASIRKTSPSFGAISVTRPQLTRWPSRRTTVGPAPKSGLSCAGNVTDTLTRARPASRCFEARLRISAGRPLQRSQPCLAD